MFPNERDVDRREKVSFDAMELINSLLQEKEHRLCSKKYRLNDYERSRRTGHLVRRPADPDAMDYQGNYVYPDDATDIKAHRFFHRIAWDRLHLTRPPFVPDVSGGDDTKYFDEEEPISDVDDAASRSHTAEASDEEIPDAFPGAASVTQVDGAPSQVRAERDPAADDRIDAKDGRDRVEATRLKDKKRPRDKVLRDKEVGRKVLELRKEGSFLGYAYRRPNLVTLAEERGRHRIPRSEIPSFD